MKTIIKPKLYYNKYQFKAEMYHQDLHHTRYVKNEAQLRQTINFRLQAGGFFVSNNVEREAKQFIDITVPLAFLNWKNANGDNVTIRTDYNMVSVYGNDLKKLKTLESIGPEVSYSQIIQQGDPDILLRNNPAHSYRTYFRSKTLPEGTYEEFGKFLKAYEKSVTPCGSLRQWAINLPKNQTWKRKYLEQSFFVEYDDESFRTILALTFDTCLGKTFKVEQR